MGRCAAALPAVVKQQTRVLSQGPQARVGGLEAREENESFNTQTMPADTSGMSRNRYVVIDMGCESSGRLLHMGRDLLWLEAVPLKWPECEHGIAQPATPLDESGGAMAKRSAESLTTRRKHRHKIVESVRAVSLEVNVLMASSAPVTLRRAAQHEDGAGMPEAAKLQPWPSVPIVLGILCRS